MILALSIRKRQESDAFDDLKFSVNNFIDDDDYDEFANYIRYDILKLSISEGYGVWQPIEEEGLWSWGSLLEDGGIYNNFCIAAFANIIDGNTRVPGIAAELQKRFEGCDVVLGYADYSDPNVLGIIDEDGTLYRPENDTEIAQMESSIWYVGAKGYYEIVEDFECPFDYLDAHRE